MVIYSRTIDILCCHLRGTPPCVYYHNMASCTWSTWQLPMVRNTKYLHMGHIIASSGLSSTNFRQSDDACVKVFCERRKYPAYRRHFLVDQPAWQSPLYIWGGPSSFGGEKKETKISLLHWFQQCSSFWDHSYKIFIFSMSTYGTYAGRAALYPYNAGQNTYSHCDYIHNDAYLWHLSYGSRIFCKM